MCSRGDLTRTCGQVCASVLVGFGMNGYEYNGSFEHTLSFNQVCATNSNSNPNPNPNPNPNQVCAILAVPAAAMVPISAWCVQEDEP